MISIIILNWNGKQDTLACLESVEKLRYRDFNVIVVDNGSSDDSVACIRTQFPQYTVYHDQPLTGNLNASKPRDSTIAEGGSIGEIQPPSAIVESRELSRGPNFKLVADRSIIPTGINLGFAEGNNVAIRLAIHKGAEYVLLLNNDTVVDPDLLDQLEATFREHPQAGIVGGKIFLFDSKETLDHLGGMWNKQTGTFTLVGLRESGALWQKPQEIDYVCGACFMIKRAVLEKIGLLEPRFFLIWEESDFCFRAKRAGFLTISAPHAHLWHKASASFVGGKPHSTYFWWRNRLLWIERNCPWQELLYLYCKTLIPNVLHMIKLHFLKTLQLKWDKQVGKKRKENLKKKEQFVLKNRAALCGVKDYLLRRFGNGPDWIYRP